MKRLLIFLLGCLLPLASQAIELRDEWSGLSFQVPDDFSVNQSKESVNGKRVTLIRSDGFMRMLYFDADRENNMERVYEGKYFVRSKIKTLDKIFFNLENPVYKDEETFMDWGRSKWEYHYYDKPGDTVPTICTIYYWDYKKLYVFFIYDKNGDFQPYKDIIVTTDGLEEISIIKLLNICQDGIKGYLLLMLMILAFVLMSLTLSDGTSFGSAIKKSWPGVLLATALFGSIMFTLRSDNSLIMLIGWIYLIGMVVIYIYWGIKYAKR